MNKILFFFTLAICATTTIAQVKIGTNPSLVNGFAVLELESNNKGLLLPRLSNTQMQALGTAASDGMMIYNADNKAVYIQRNGQFVRLADTTRTFSFPYTAIVNSSGNGFTLNNNGAGNAIAGNAAGGNGITGTAGAGNGGVFSSSQGNALVTLSGNVGIGTATPNHPFTVVSNNDGIVNKSGTVEVGTYVTNAEAYLKTYSNHPLNFTTNNGSAQMTLATNGYLGIATSNPGYLLDVNGRQRLRHNGASAGLWLNKSTNAEASFIGQVDDNTFGIYDAASNAWRFAFNHNTGKVGFGTTTPNHTLTAISSGDGIVSKSGTVEVGTYVASGGAAYLQTYSNHPLSFATNNGTAQMTLATSGNVGIGTTNPTSRLSVNGALQIIDGTQGAGKVLTSDGNGNASWRNQAFTNAERFMIGIGTSTGGVNFQYTNKYNYSTTNSINTANGTVTINKAGMYHFEVSATSFPDSDVTQTGASPVLLELTLSLTPGVDYDVIKVPYYKVNTGYRGFAKGSIDIYIPAGSTIYPNVHRSGNAGTYGYLSGYLISE